MRFEQINVLEMVNLERIQRNESLNLIDFNRGHCAYQRKPECYQSMKQGLLIQLHNLSQLSYLSLSEMWYIVPTGENITSKLSENQITNRVVWCLQEHVKRNIYRYFYETLNNPMYPLPLRFIRSFLNHYRIAQLRDSAMYQTETFDCVLRYMHQFHTGNDFISEFLTAVCSTQLMKRFIFQSFSWTRSRHVRYILEMCNNARFDIRRFLTSDSENNLVSNPHPLCPVLECLFHGKVKFLEMLLQHGFEAYEFNAGARFSIYQKYLLDINELTLRRLPDDSFRRKFLLLDTFCLVAEYSIHINRKDWAECASLLFRSIPEPLITLTELVQIHSSKINSSSLCLTFVNNFPEIKAPQFMPRTLEHLCRCTIRKSLARNFQLPNGIYTLPLPRKLTQYLLLEF